MRERRDRVHGPYKHKRRWRIVVEYADRSVARAVESYETEREAAEAKAKLERGFAAKASAISVRGAVDAWLEVLWSRADAGELKPPTVERIEYHLHAMLQLEKHGAKDLRALTPRFAARLYEERTGAVDTHRNALSTVKSWGAWLVVKSWLNANPFEKVTGKGRRKRGKPQLGQDAAVRVYSYCVEHAATDVGAEVTLGYLLLGARATELLMRPVRDLDAGGTVLHVSSGKTENSKRPIAVPDVLQPLLLRRAKNRPALSPLYEECQHRRRPADWAREQVRRILKLAGVDAKVTPHGLRGTASTIAHEAHQLPNVIAAALGHTAEVNQRSYTDQNRAEAAKRERALQVLQGGKR